MTDPNYTNYECPNCGEDVPVALPASVEVTCPGCDVKLEIHPDAEYSDGLWHDDTTLSVIQ